MAKNVIKNFLLTIVVCLVLSSVAMYKLTENAVIERKKKTNLILRNQSNAIINDLTIMEERLKAFRAYLIGKNGDYEEVDVMESYIVKDPKLKNILIAPNSIVEIAFPKKENEKIVGLDLTSPDNPTYLGAIEAIETKEVIFSGPYILTQGGEAVTARLAVYLPDGKGHMEYWGLVSLTEKFPDIFKNVSTEYLIDAGYNISFLQNNYDGSIREILSYGDIGESPEEYDFSYGNLSFTYKVSPDGGWIDRTNFIFYILAFVLTSFSIAAAVAIVTANRNKLTQKASTDELTGLLNRKGAVSNIERLMNSHSFKKGALILLDLDHFKDVNDTMGHPMGDEVLKETAYILKTLCRSTDTVGRLGGDEFIVFLGFDNDKDFVIEKAELIRKRLYRKVIDSQNEIQLSSSIGISFIDDTMDSFEELYKSADQALYVSKGNGRNKYTIYDETMNEK